MKTYFRLIKLTVLPVTLLLLCSCASMRQSSSPITLSAQEYLQLANHTQGVEKQTYQLNAIDAYLIAHQINNANALITQLSYQSLPPTLMAQLQLQKAQIALMENRVDDSLQLLQTVNASELTGSNLQVQYLTIYAKAYQAKGGVINSANMRIRLNPLLTDTEAQKQNLWAIWQGLQTLSVDQLKLNESQTTALPLKGWLNLTLITKQFEGHPDQLAVNLNAWRAMYPDHPANALLPKQLSITNLPTQSDRVALLLPLSGRYGHYGQAIRNGFFTAYYNQKKRVGYAPLVSVLDTAGKNINDVYRLAVTQGAKFIVGPLEKPDVQSLIDHHTASVPTLVLNTLPNNESARQSDVYTFALSPTDEAEQAAKKAWQDHYHRVIVIAKNNAWSQQVANAFTAQWKQLGGSVVAVQFFNDQQTLSTKIRDVLQLSHALQDKQSLQKMFGENVRALPRRRHDFDSIFLVASLSEAKQILPLLKFYFAGNIPVFSISQIHDGASETYHDADLDGLIFCDIPWVFSRPLPGYLQDMKEQIKTVWPNNYANYARFYAFGVDAFNLTYQLNKMKMLPQLGIAGATGTLYLTPTHQIYRQLPWLQIKQGQAEFVG